MDSINTERSYTEYEVTEPTTDFAIGFDNYSEGAKDTIHVTLDGVNLANLDYTVVRKNVQVIEVTPAIESGIVRIQRETSIDQAFHKFTAGALFSPKAMDENFEQVRHSQQEVIDKFNFLETNANSVLAQAKDTTERAEGAVADVAEFLVNGVEIAALEVTMLEPTEVPFVVAGGTPTKREYDLHIPRGVKGERGDVHLATFDVDIQTGRLIMSTSVDYAGVTFAIRNNNLEVTL